MAIREVPRKMARLEDILKERGGVRLYVMERINKGERAEDVSAELTELLGESFSVYTLYAWIRRWNKEREGVTVP